MKIPDVDEWKRDDIADAYAISDGKNMILNLKKIMPTSIDRLKEHDPEGIRLFKTFIIERKLFFKKTDLICHYIDYFSEFFDPDKELLSVYLHIKKQVDSKITHLTRMEFLKLVFSKFMTDTRIKRHIYEMVDANYKFDVTVDAKTGRKFEGPFDFNNDEAKSLLAVSIFMKFIIPITSQYINTSKLYSANELDEVMMDVFVESIYKIGPHGDVDADELMIKLYKFTEQKIIKHYGLHNTLWNQQCALRGLTESAHIDTILSKHLLSNNMFKFKFNKNIISFLKSIVETQLLCTINRLKYKANPVRIDDSKNYNGLSGKDKLEQTAVRIDETSIIRCTRSIDYEFRKLEKEFGEISGEEHEYYMSNFILFDRFHNMLIDYCYAQEFGGYAELKSISADERCDFMIYAKRKLLQQGFKQLPSLLSSNLQGKLSHRMLQNSKYIAKTEASDTYINLTKNKYRYLAGYNDTVILDLESKVLNNIYTYVEFDHPELTGTEIDFDEDIISTEIHNFIDMV